MDRILKTELSNLISEATDCDFAIREIKSVSGGCIHQSYLLSAESARYFVKVNRANKADLFAAEADGLRAIRQTKRITCPAPIAESTIGEHCVLVMEALDLGVPAAPSWQEMGRQLATLHQATSHQYGWHRDNYIGESPQTNEWSSCWTDFFCEQRLEPQFQLAEAKGIHFKKKYLLLEAARSLLKDHRPEASLLHGDLWSGNVGFLAAGTPVIYDPACYFGDRETDLAFSEFFGGFPAAFYTAYREAWPVDPDYQQRKPLYNLYHVLNHANLFGGRYVNQSKSMIQELLKV